MGMSGGFYEMLLNLFALIGNDDGMGYLESGSGKLPGNRRTGKVFTRTLRSGVANGENGGGIHGQASRTFSSVSRLASSSSRSPSRSSPWVERVTVCSRLL